MEHIHTAPISGFMNIRIIRSLRGRPPMAKSDCIFRVYYSFETEVVKVSRGMIWPTIWQEIVLQR